MVPLTPLSFLRRSADVFGSKVAVVDVDRPDTTYAGLRDRADRLADAVRGVGLDVGDRVAVLALNGLPLLEAHYGIPGAGGVLVAMNTRLSSAEYTFILEHSGARILIVDRALAPLIAECDLSGLDLVVGIGDTGIAGVVDYEQWLAEAPPGPGLVDPQAEDQPIAINYTSGTTGRPKGVLYTHRGAYLNALGTASSFGVRPTSVYLWTLPMFHCNGWCYTWAVTAMGARHVCIPKPDAPVVIASIADQGVTHFCAAPVVLNAVINHPDVRPFDHPVACATGGAPPSPATIARAESLGIELVHLYGMTETYGPSLVCEPQPSWASLPEDERAERMARQGVRTVTVDAVRVVDLEMNDVPADAATMGEIVVRSNTTMAGYYRDEEATARAFTDGWLHTGDLAVLHPDGYVEIRDRAKDIIISGGENISSIEVEHALAGHPAVLEAAVVAVPDDQWGEVPIAFVVLMSGEQATEQELIDHVRGRIARFKAPKKVVFCELPKTSTGKIQKTVLRERAREEWPGHG